MTKRTNKALVLEAVEDLHNLEQIATRETLHEYTGLKLTTIDDRLKTLHQDGDIIRVQRGVYVPVVRHPPARHISQTILPDGMVVLEIGDDVMHLTPREARTLAMMVSALATQASQIELGQKASFATQELDTRTRRLERMIEKMVVTLTPDELTASEVG